MKNIDLALLEIAKKNIYSLENRENLNTQNSDSLDFFETSIWEFKKALEEAYELGRNSR